MRLASRQISRVVAITLAALLAPAAAHAAAPPGGQGERVLTQEEPFDGFYYGDFETLALAGRPLDAAFCMDVGYPRVTVFYRQRRDGSWTARWRDRTTVTLYDTTLGGPEFVEQQCEAILVDGADPPEPLATGTAQVRSFQSRLSDPGGPPLPGNRIVNRTFGFATDDDGQRYRVKAQADVVLDDDLVPVGSPTEFQSLRLVEVGGR